MSSQLTPERNAIYQETTLSIRERIALFPEYRVLIVLAIIVAIFASISRDFLGPLILPGILLLGAELSILAIGETLVIMSGEIDLSIASIYGWGALIATLLSNAGVPFVVSFLIAIAFGVIIGFLNGIVTLRFRVPALITTLAMMWVLRGLLMGLFGGTFISYRGHESILLRSFGGQVWLIPRLAFWFLGIAIVAYLLLNHSRFGNHLFATGGNTETARALGINTYRVKLMSFVISGALAAFAGAAYLGRMDWFLTRLGMSNMGFGIEIEAIAASVMGGTAFTGGVGSVIAVCLAAFAFSSFKSGLILVGVSSYWVDGVTALLLIGFCLLQSMFRLRQ